MNIIETDAAPVSPKVAERINEFLARVEKLDVPAARIIPGTDGSTQVRWAFSEADLNINFGLVAGLTTIGVSCQYNGTICEQFAAILGELGITVNTTLNSKRASMGNERLKMLYLSPGSNKEEVIDE